MSKFITGEHLEDKIYDIIWNSEKVLLIVSPFIKLDNYFKKLFNKHQNNPLIHLILVFGKNENEVKRSMSMADFEYFKKFPNVSIIYVPKLHAKYYGNEKQGVITSINLYDHSFKNNIEYGVYSKLGIFDKFTSNPDNEAFQESMKIAKSNEVVFIKRPVYKHKKLVVSFGKDYVKSDILLDSTEKFYGRSIGNKSIKKMLTDFPKELEYGKIMESRPLRHKNEKFVELQLDKSKSSRTSKVVEINELYRKNRTTKSGHCIRCAEKIKFAVDKPYCYSCYSSRSQFENPNYEENYCHSCGEDYNSTMLKPNCYSCYSKGNKSIKSATF